MKNYWVYLDNRKILTTSAGVMGSCLGSKFLKLCTFWTKIRVLWIAGVKSMLVPVMLPFASIMYTGLNRCWGPSNHREARSESTGIPLYCQIMSLSMNFWVIMHWWGHQGHTRVWIKSLFFFESSRFLLSRSCLLSFSIIIFYVLVLFLVTHQLWRQVFNLCKLINKYESWEIKQWKWFEKKISFLINDFLFHLEEWNSKGKFYF